MLPFLSTLSPAELIPIATNIKTRELKLGERAVR